MTTSTHSIIWWMCMDGTMLLMKTFPLGDGDDVNNGHIVFWALRQFLNVINQPLNICGGGGFSIPPYAR